MLPRIPEGSSNVEPNLPEDYLDPVTYLPLIQAVFIKCGHSLNEDTARGLIERNMSCPLDRKPFKKFYPNIVLRNIVQASLKSPPPAPIVENESPSAAAIAHFERGKKLFFDNQFEQAANAFLAAMILYPKYEKVQAFFESALEAQKHNPPQVSPSTLVPPSVSTTPVVLPTLPSSALSSSSPAPAPAPATISSQSGLQKLPSSALSPSTNVPIVPQTPNPSSLPSYVTLAFTSAGKGKALIRAIDDGNMDAITHLLRLEAPTNEKDGQNRTPLLAACQKKNEVLLDLLIQNGASVNGEDAKAALISAMENGDTSIVRLLVNGGVPLMEKTGPKPDKVHADKQTPCIPLEIAAKKGDLEIFRLILATKNLPNGVKLDAFHTYFSSSTDFKFESVGDHALLIACQHGNLEVVRLLLEQGVDLDKDVEGNTYSRSYYTLRGLAKRNTGSNASLANLINTYSRVGSSPKPSYRTPSFSQM